MELDKGLFRLLTHVILKYFWYYLGAVICLYLTHYVGSYLPFYAKELADLVTEGPEKIQTSKYFLLAFGILFFRTASRLLFFFPARCMERDMRVKILNLLESTIPLRYQKYAPGQLFQILSNDTEQIRALVGFAFLQIGNIVLAIVVLVPKLNNYHPELLVALWPMLLASIIFAILVGSTRHYHRKSADMQGEVQNFIMETYTGKKTIKNYHAENSFVKFFRKRSLKELDFSYKAGVAISYSTPLVPFGVGLSFLYGAHIIYTQNLGASSLVLFSGFVFLFLEPLMFLSWIGVVYTSSIAAFNRIEELVKDIGIASPSEVWLQEKNLNVSDPQKFIVKFWENELPLIIPSDGVTVLVGKTGCGKSEVLFQLATILKEKGKRVSYISQSPYIYNDKLIKNIFLGREPSEDDKDLAYNLLDLFGLTYLATGKEALFELEVGENGKKLSGGQQKRLALVRGILSPHEYLIWDDPFSSVDLILERVIFTELKNSNLLKNKTVIFSGHRFSTVKLCDYVIYLDPEIGILDQGSVERIYFDETKEEKRPLYEYFKKQMV